jgi:MFS family permease
MSKRSAFPSVFWIANSVEILERFAYYGIFNTLGIYMDYLGYSRGGLGLIQSIFLFFSYIIPIISGSFSDRYGFKKMLLVSYLAYFPSILLLLITKSYSGIALSMLCIGFAAGIFKPLVSATVRAVTDTTNKALGFGIFYQMVNIGATLGPLFAGAFRAVSWKNAFIADAIIVGVMFLITLLFYKDPPRAIEGESLKKKFQDIFTELSNVKFTLFLVLIGFFYWIPLWSFINILPIYIEKSLDTAYLYFTIKNIFGSGFANFISRPDVHGVRHIMGETISNTAYFVIVFQLVVSSVNQRFKAMPAFMGGMLIASAGFVVLAFAHISVPSLVFLGIFLFAIGEMSTSPRIMEYITWLAPKEKAGLYMGFNYLATAIGAALSGITYTTISGWFVAQGHPEYIWYTLAIHYVIGVIVIYWFIKTRGDFKEMDA